MSGICSRHQSHDPACWLCTLADLRNESAATMGALRQLGELRRRESAMSALFRLAAAMQWIGYAACKQP